MTILFEGQRVYNHIRHLSVEIGPHVMGSAAGKQAGDYIRSHFESLGLEVQEQTFDVEAASLMAHKLEILEPALGEILSRPILKTPDTPEEGLVGELVFVEGSQEPQVGPHLAGKIVLWSITEPIEYWTRYREVVKHRPTAVIVIWPALGIRPKHFQMPDELVKPYKAVTSFCVSWEDGLRLVRAGAKKARLHLRSEQHKGTTCNIIAEVKGSAYPDEIIVVGGHYDTVSDLPGATDNASGVATVMELTRLYVQRGSKRTVRFVAWAGEEGGYLGSKHYVQELKKQDKEARASDAFVKGRDKTDLERHLLCVNLDVLGMALCHNVCYVLGPPEVTATINTLAKELGISHKVKEEFYGSDGESFAWAGVPAISFARGGAAFNYIHTPDDTIDLIQVEQLQRIGTFVDTFLTRSVTEAQGWPFERRIPDELRKKIVEMVERLGWVEETEKGRENV